MKDIHAYYTISFRQYIKAETLVRGGGYTQLLPLSKQGFISSQKASDGKVWFCQDICSAKISETAWAAEV